MRIAFFDNNLQKFNRVLHDHWAAKGHWVTFEPGYNPNLIETCDLCFFEMADTNIHLATRERPAKQGKVVCRIIDVDAWTNGPAGIREGYVDDVFFIAKHIQEHCQKFSNLQSSRQHLVPLGVDINKFTFRKKNRGKKIAFIATRLTEEKGFDIALQILADLRKKSSQYELHVVGRMFENDLWQKTIDHIMKTNHLEGAVTFYNNLPYDKGTEINEFLEDKDYLLLPSRKEAFSFATAEAMAKGIKPVVWNFYRAEDIWPKDILFNTPAEAVEMIDSDVYNGDHYRQYISDNYSLEKHLKTMDEILGL